MSTLHDKIMNLPCVVTGEHAIAYKLGHRDALHAAAELAAKQDALLVQMATALESVIKEFDEFIDLYETNEFLVDKYKDRLHEERKVITAYKESQA